ncbi:MAG TPA: sigma-54 dependent transcriptional regulator [Thermoanaerobaculia bacterium]|jgi:DNA-binding NtrC family response regulator|nr:sigma-54 dependent transcriptional regulator [Thermoanaerobaculia bacterium]
MSSVLIVEDHEAVARAIEVLFEVHDIPCRVARGPEEAVEVVGDGSVGVVLQDMNFAPGAMSGEEGMTLFRRLRERAPNVPVVLMTAFTSLETAVQLVKEGASDYIAKPWDDAKLVLSVRSLLRLHALETENRKLKTRLAEARQKLASEHDLLGLVYESQAMHDLVGLTVQVAAADVPVLVTGPSGAGKEKIAEIVQANSRRRAKPFVRVNAGALPETLLEAELFGAEPGAFTGATKLRIGRFEAADGGTLFLDEIGTLSAAGQVKLLRVLQSGEFERVGSSKTRKTDVRVIAATNASLTDAVKEGRFREDLYYRLDIVELKVLPLRERPDDILPLARTFLEESEAARTLSPAAERALLAHPWPGNVRELRNRIQRASIVAAARAIEPVDLDLGNLGTVAPPARPPEVEADRSTVEALLVKHDGSVSSAAAELGLSRQALYRRMERLGISLERRPRDV